MEDPKSSHKLSICLFFLMLGLITTTSVHGQETRVGFYSSTCPRAEDIVRSTVGSHFRSNPAIAPGILRMHFHDCFDQGCDGSVLIDGPNTRRAPRRIAEYQVMTSSMPLKQSSRPPALVSFPALISSHLPHVMLLFW